MSLSKSIRIALSLAAVGISLIGLFLLLDGRPRTARADPGTLFAKSDGTGTACTPDQPCALQEALNQATDGDTIFVAGGVYTSTGAAVISVTKTITLYGGWDGTAGPGSLVLPGVYTTTLDGENTRRVIYITGTVAPILDGFTLQNGQAAGDSGGALYSYNASPTIANCRILSSTADSGGGLAFWYGVPTLGNSSVMGNVATGTGENDGGGGLYLSNSAAWIKNNVIQNNNAPNAAGGGVYMLQSAALFEANTVLGNQARWAGGLEVVGSSPFTMTNNILALNGAQDGSPVRVYGISDQPACPDQCPSQGILLHNTIVTNTSSNTSWMIAVGPTATLAFVNTIIGLPDGIYVERGGSVTLDTTLYESGVRILGGPGDFSGRNSLYGDPAFVDPGNGDYHIGLGSAAIDRGLDAGVTDDVDGQPRPQGSGYDIGADETGLIVTKQVEPDPVEAGAQLTYTIHVVNFSDVELNATITDTLPFSVTLDETSGGTLILPGGAVAITWTATISADGGLWTETITATVDAGCTEPLVNLVEVTTDEGARGEGSVTVRVGGYIYLPLIMRS